MNSDPRESAAWRAFGMLDSDETAGFDEALRGDADLHGASREMDRLAAAIAAVTVPPVKPQAGQLERLHARLGLNVRKKNRNWLGITGWAAAAALAMIFVLERTLPAGQPEFTRKTKNHRPDKITRDESPLPVETVASDPVETEIVVESAPEPAILGQVVPKDKDASSYVRVETKKLIQQIEVLREQLAGLERRDRERFDIVPGMSWPIVMEMRPPGVAPTLNPATAAGTGPAGASTPAVDDSMAASSITSILGDALIGSSDASRTLVPPTPGYAPPPVVKPASAIPIYDAARDSGTLVVNSLPEKSAAESYNLWVTTKKSREPILVGEIPESDVTGADSFDFNLGSPGIIPSGFILTKDAKGKAPVPSTTNTILRGPN